jgi:hypothetical protein
VVLTSVSAAGPTPVAEAPALIDVTHVPPVLTVPGEPTRLRFGLVCTPRPEGLPCDGSGTVYLRSGQAGPFRPYPLQRGEESKDGRYYLDVPPALDDSRDGFSYYAVLRDDATGATVSTPSGGEAAPQVSFPLQDAATIVLGRHAFGAVREPDGSFDVLDQHDMLRRYRGDGTEKWAQKVADRTWAKLDRGPSVLEQPSEQWMPVAEGEVPLTRAEQKRSGRAAHQGILVDRVGDGELRVAEVRGDVPFRGWRITSDTPLGEVQLAQPHGNGVLIVTRAYTDDRDEFVVLLLGGHGLVERFSVASGSWTETAPLARFRLAHGELYRLRTTTTGATVDRFDLEVPQ